VRYRELLLPAAAGGDGEEMRNYANLIAEKWKIASSAVFQPKAKKLV
jgi:phytoene dehydrogenase-like protein